MSSPGYHHNRTVLATNISSLLRTLDPSTYDEVAPKVEYWIEHVITERFMTADDLVEKLSPLAWELFPENRRSVIPRFLKEFRDAPNRSKGARSFVDKFCLRVLRWFTVAFAEDPSTHYTSSILLNKGGGLVRAASFVGHLIDCDLLSRELVGRYLKTLTPNYNGNGVHPDYRAGAIYQLFITAGNTLLQGLLEPGDVHICFELLAAQSYGILGPDSARILSPKLDVRCGPFLYVSH